MSLYVGDRVVCRLRRNEYLSSNPVSSEDIECLDCICDSLEFKLPSETSTKAG